MKALYTSAFASLLSMCASAQVVFDLPDAIPPFGTEPRGWWYADPITLTTSGQNVVWDLSTDLSEQAFATYPSIIVPPASTPAGSDFPEATHAIGDVFIPGDTTWNYLRLTTDSLFWLGNRGSMPDYDATCSDPRVMGAFPFSYGQLVEDSSDCDITIFNNPATLDGLELVATGTMITPIGTISDAVLLRIHIDGAASNSYRWYRTGNILVPFGQLDDQTLTLWIPGSISGIGENGHALLASYPNPADEEVFVHLPFASSELRSIQLFDQVGRALRASITSTTSRLRVDVSGLSPGTYLLRLSGPDGTCIARIVKQ